MGLLGRAAGFALMGPIGALGPTEATKRHKKQLAELKKQTAALEALQPKCTYCGETGHDRSYHPGK